MSAGLFDLFPLPGLQVGMVWHGYRIGKSRAGIWTASQGDTVIFRASTARRIAAKIYDQVHFGDQRDDAPDSIKAAPAAIAKVQA